MLVDLRNAGILLVLLATTLIMSAAGQEIVAKGLKQVQFSVIGIEVRTNNAREASGDGLIPKQWDQFFKDHVLEDIPNKDGSDITVVYSNYQSDRNGDYDYLIGARVVNSSSVPSGMVAKSVSGGTYSIVTTAIGPVSKVVPMAWQAIWDSEDKEKLGGRRAYKTDFEVYDERSRDPQKSQVDIHVGLK